jgi:hypothetical protein
MKLDEHAWYPYPSDPVTRLGFLVGDIIAVGVILLIVISVFQALLR